MHLIDWADGLKHILDSFMCNHRVLSLRLNQILFCELVSDNESKLVEVRVFLWDGGYKSTWSFVESRVDQDAESVHLIVL